MEIVPFVPNYIRNTGKDFTKHDKTRDETRPEPAKKRTEIKGAIKTKADVEKALAKAGKRVKSKGKVKKGTDRRTARGRARKKNLSAKVQGV